MLEHRKKVNAWIGTNFSGNHREVQKNRITSSGRKNWKTFYVNTSKRLELDTIDGLLPEYFHSNYALAIICIPSELNRADIIQRNAYFSETKYRNVINWNWYKEANFTEWLSAPLIVTKKTPAKYRLTFDYLPVIAATTETAWSVPHIAAVVQEMWSS